MRFVVQQFVALHQLALDALALGKNVSISWDELYGGHVELSAGDTITTVRFNGEGFDVYRNEDATDAPCKSNLKRAEALDVIMGSSASYAMYTPKAEPEISKRSSKQAAVTKFRTPTPGTKAELIVNMLLREAGATAEELKAALDWPTISVQVYAHRYGLKLVTDEIGDDRGSLRYYATRIEQPRINIVENSHG